MKITVIGGGNIGTLMAAEFAAKGNDVTIHTSKPAMWNRRIEVYDAEENFILAGNISKITDSMKEAIVGADYIWVVVPAQLFHSFAEKMLPYLKAGQKIGIVPGSGGAEFAFADAIKMGCTLFGFQRVHSIARLKEYGKSVYQLGRKSELQLGTIPISMSREICETVSGLFDMPCVALDNYLSVTLTPSNPILHTSRLCSMFHDYQPGVFFDRNILFYEEWTDLSSKTLISCDAELQKLCDVIPMDLSSVMSLKEYYESPTAEAMTAKISSIKAFKGITSPMCETEKGWVPDWNSRYFVADFPFGLKIIKDIARMFSVATPNIDSVWEWFVNTNENKNYDSFHTELNAQEFLSLYY